MAGMTEVQQALTLGRRDLTQNRSYQHASIEKRNESLSRFKDTFNPAERLKLFKEGVKTGWVQGQATETYNYLQKQDPLLAESFLETHVLAAHITPYGACAHDFSKAPCPKYLKCFDKCGHLHRTSDPNETDKLQELEARLQKNIERMERQSSQVCSDHWIKHEISKLEGVRQALSITPHENEFTPVFEDGLMIDQKRNSAVGDK